MLLSNLYPISGERQIDILTKKEKIVSVVEYQNSPANTSSPQTIKFNDAIVFPGLINSHDHLDFNLFPQLGNRIYNNYVEWGKDIHEQNKDIIDNVLKIPSPLRVQWGIYKNLLNGVTTVVNHGPKLVNKKEELIAIWQKTHALHSVANEKYWKYKLNMPFISHQPYTIHIAEGTDNNAKEEINTLIKWNLFHRELIGIHGVAMNEKQAAKFKAMVWCPDSNYFLLGKTANISKLKHQTKILFGTDSTVSANWNLWNHLRAARNTKMVTDIELFNMITSIPANIWNIPLSGLLAKDYYADIVIAKMGTGMKVLDAFFTTNPEDILMVLHKGNIRLFDADIYPQLINQGIVMEGFNKIYINDKCKYIFGNLPGLIKSIKYHFPEAEFPVTC